MSRLHFVHQSTTVNYKPGKGAPRVTSEQYLVEAFQIKDGVAVAPDQHLSARTYDASKEEREKIDTIVFQAEFEVGAADTYKIEGKVAPIEVSETKPYLVLWAGKAPPNPDNVHWVGKRTKYTLTYTFTVATSKGEFKYSPDVK